MTNEATASDHIKQVIESGTLHQRVILLATSVAHWAYTDAAIEPPLTPQEHAQLQASFRTPAEKRLLQKYRKVDDSIRLFILQLSQHLVEHDLVLSHINRLNQERIMLSVTIPEFCDVIGSAIAKRFGWKQQVEIFREAAKHKLSRIFGSKTKLLTETIPDTGEPRALFTFPDFDLPNSPEEIENLAGDEYFVASLVAWGKRLTKTRRIAKANLKVLQEVMKAERFTIKPYKHFLKQAEKRLRTEPPLTVLQTAEDMREEILTLNRAAMFNKAELYTQLLQDHEKKRVLFWQTYDEVEVTDADCEPFRNVFRLSGVSYGKS